jgi:Flp pilus assembly protein CpaB
LLVALAAIAAFVAARGSNVDHAPRYVVARHDLDVGRRLTRTDLGLASARLPDGVARRAYTTADPLVGAVVVAPIAKGELLQRGQVADATRQPGRNQVSFAVDADRAAGGDLRPGDRVAVLVTPSGGGTPAVVATDLEVIHVRQGGSQIEGSGRLTVLVAADRDQIIGIARATNPDLVTVVRTTGVSGDDQLHVTNEQAPK